MAKAIRAAGIHLIQSLDTSGLRNPFAVFNPWLQATLSELALPQPFISRLRRFAKIGRDLIPALYERRRLGMLAECDQLAAVSPPARDSIQAYVKGLGRPDIAKKLTVIPHPVSSAMVYRGEKKQKKVIVVGRWSPTDSAQKDPDLTLEILRVFLERHSDWKAEIIGPEALSLGEKVARLPTLVRSRLTLRNFVQHEELRDLYAQSRILLCASRFESFHIASAEAVCCGCSIVVAEHPLLASTAWFTRGNGGTLALNRSLAVMAKAMNNEAELWEQSQRCSTRISGSWIPELHAQNIAEKIVSIYLQK